MWGFLCDLLEEIHKIELWLKCVFFFFFCASVGEAEGSVDQTIPIVLTQQELEALVQQQQQLQDIHNQPEPAEPEPQHTNLPTGRPTTALQCVWKL